MGEDEVFLGDGNGQAGAVGVAGLFQQGRDKALYGAGGDAQLCGDLLIFQPLTHQPQHLDLPGGELGAADLPQAGLRGVVRVEAFPRHGAVHHLQQALRGHILVPEALGPGGLCPFQVAFLHHGGDDDDFGLRVPGLDLCRHINAVPAALGTHIHQHQIHGVPGALGQRHFRCAQGGHPAVAAAVLHKVLHVLPGHPLVFHDQNAGHIVSSFGRFTHSR